jgi:hypothetical protein
MRGPDTGRPPPAPAPLYACLLGTLRRVPGPRGPPGTPLRSRDRPSLPVRAGCRRDLLPPQDHRCESRPSCQPAWCCGHVSVSSSRSQTAHGSLPPSLGLSRLHPGLLGCRLNGSGSSISRTSASDSRTAANLLVTCHQSLRVSTSGNKSRSAPRSPLQRDSGVGESPSMKPRPFLHRGDAGQPLRGPNLEAHRPSRGGRPRAAEARRLWRPAGIADLDWFAKSRPEAVRELPACLPGSWCSRLDVEATRLRSLPDDGPPTRAELGGRPGSGWATSRWRHRLPVTTRVLFELCAERPGSPGRTSAPAGMMSFRRRGLREGGRGGRRRRRRPRRPADSIAVPDDRRSPS